MTTKAMRQLATKTQSTWVPPLTSLPPVLSPNLATPRSGSS